MKLKVNNLLVEKTFYLFVLSLSFSLVLKQEDTVTACLGRKQQSVSPLLLLYKCG